jgi:hypothetical protein
MVTFELEPYYRSVKDRTQSMIDDVQRPIPPPVDDWKHISDSELQALDAFLEATRETTSRLGEHHGPEVLSNLNVDSRFETHLDVMSAYVDVLARTPFFVTFLREQGISPSFMKALVKLHDFGRSVFNGPLPLKYIDGVSDGILRKILPDFPTQYLHSIKWITGEIILPESDDELSPHQQIGLILKAIDTLGKLDPAGKLMDPDVFFSENGPYAKWAEEQKLKQRFPFVVVNVKRRFKGQREITAEAYAEQDKALTIRGMRIAETLTGTPFQDLRQRAEVQFENNTHIAG